MLPILMLSACNTAPKVQESQESSAHETAGTAPLMPAVTIEPHSLKTELDLPGELVAYQDVPLHAKVEGFVSWIGVDRGSTVHKGQPLITITAPELNSKVNEAQAKMSASEAGYRQAQSSYQAAVSKQAEAKAKLDSDQLTYSRLLEAAKTPGAIAQNEVDISVKTVEGDKAKVDSMRSEVAAAANLVTAQKNNISAARNVVQSVKDMSEYLKICAPFDGVITERNVHDGSIVAVESSRTGLPMLRIQQKSLLRLVVAVPEESVGGVKIGTKIPFSVPAFLGKTFSGTVARLGFALDTKTRTMPVELDVPNPSGVLEPGMFATVKWSLTRNYSTLFAPLSAVATDLKGTFVMRVNNDVADRVSVTRGQQMGNLVEIVGNIKAGDLVALKATDEIKSGSKVKVKTADQAQILSASKHNSSGGE
jgi:multidrug efflux pump subunit AcrA (membrane-fusion protein)